MTALKFRLPFQIIFCILCICATQAQQRSSTLTQSSIEDGIVILTVDKPVYLPNDTVNIKVQLSDSSTQISAIPILIIDGVILKSIAGNIYSVIIPKTCNPGQYKVRIKIVHAQGKSFVYTTDCAVNVEERQNIELISSYVRIEPDGGSQEMQTPVALERYKIRNLRVMFQRDKIGENMGPQFIKIVTTVISRDGITAQTYERRVLTFRQEKDPNRDGAMLVQYRNAYGPYAAIKAEEFEQVQINVDTLPDWAIVKITIAPDYAIKIGGYDRNNTYPRYFRIRGPKIEIGISLGIPKVLFDTQAKDTITYGNYSAMIRFYYVSETTGNRFPVNLGVGTFGVNSPIDVNKGKGGFALSAFLDVAEVTRLRGITLLKKIYAGLEITPFFPIEKKARFLINAQVGFAL
jgi:hypothetical protein